MGTGKDLTTNVINSFIVSIIDIFLQMVNIRLSPKDQYLRNNIELNDNILVLIGVTGDFEGQIAIEISENIAMEIASTMMNGLPNIIFDDNVKQYIIEVVTTIIGDAVSKLYNLNISLDLTPITIIKGKELLLFFSSNKIFSVPFQSKNGKVELYIDFKF